MSAFNMYRKADFFKSAFSFLSQDESDNIRDIFDKSRLFVESNLEILEVFNFSFFHIDSKDLKNIIDIHICDLFIKKRWHNLIFDYNDAEKLENLIDKKQINSKLCSKFLTKVYYILEQLSMYHQNCIDYIYFFIEHEVKESVDEFISKTISKEILPFKKAFKDVFPFISNETYLMLSNRLNSHFTFSSSFYNSINEIFIEKCNYDILKCNRSQIFIPLLSIFNEYILFSTFDLNISKHQNEFIFKFLSCISDDNEKEMIIVTLMNRLKDKYSDYYDKMIENQLPLNYLVDYNNMYSLRVYLNIFSYFNQYQDTTLKNVESLQEGMFIPKKSDIDNIKKGEQLFKKIITQLYPNDYAEILNLFSNIDNVVKFQTKFDSRYNGRKLITRETDITLGVFLDSFIFRSLEFTNEKQSIEFKYPTFFSNTDTLNRLYYQVYLMSVLDSECINAIFHNIYGVELKRAGFKSKYELDNEFRDEIFEKLKVVLKNFEVDITENYKEYYVASLLDYNIARENEVELYKELEQKGDSLFELCCNEVFFYNNEISEYKKHDLDQVVSNKYQSKISEKINLNEIYKTNFLIENPNYNENFIRKLGDSVEMIIGAISIEHGISKAIEFTHKILDSKLYKISKRSYKYDENREYHEKCFPSINGIENNYHIYNFLDAALTKVILCYSYGNETLEKRNEINLCNNSSCIFYFDKEDNLEVNLDYYLIEEYLYNGIEYVVNKYKNCIKI